ncbi:hypothetical protein GUITHDRAFT_122424 [Guillardia theta CCMP2712]|uniref:Uncharacterized protein n=1 Tax=Guillardia theta (strain CCMP2712) TaxID=905079 RepID=L1I5M7_GUITC|nr:hypothetical protein GUITHDRAFT_122424 [Guillardia theta CCMP2712]EKX31377.1 hypothetical protein GUITHDRAFT_122424 [Guillardia theta CCMP2712]|eukprot:XP_005818357.1 hypothetical protein GUITHDRAFT_122424 [Guillardia theta CCMP2712]
MLLIGDIDVVDTWKEIEETLQWQKSKLEGAENSTESESFYLSLEDRGIFTKGKPRRYKLGGWDGGVE